MWGWEILPKKWTRNCVVQILKAITNFVKDINPAPYALRGDTNRPAIPLHELPNLVEKHAVQKTMELGLNGTIAKKNMTAIVAMPGAVHQQYYVDTRVNTGYSVLHVMSKRYLHLKDARGEHIVKLAAGDIVIIAGNVCHAGAENHFKKSSTLLHVPIRYNHKFTETC